MADYFKLIRHSKQVQHRCMLIWNPAKLVCEALFNFYKEKTPKDLTLRRFFNKKPSRRDGEGHYGTYFEAFSSKKTPQYEGDFFIYEANSGSYTHG